VDAATKTMNFEVLLREKVMSNDGQLTINFNRLKNVSLITRPNKIELTTRMRLSRTRNAGSSLAN
jgi:hypothetical protein